MDQGEENPLASGGDEPRDLRKDLRGVAHDINGALNNLALNLELLDRSTAQGAVAPEGARERYFASLRRAVDKIGEIVSQRLLPLAGGDPKGNKPET